MPKHFKYFDFISLRFIFWDISCILDWAWINSTYIIDLSFIKKKFKGYSFVIITNCLLHIFTVNLWFDWFTPYLPYNICFNSFTDIWLFGITTTSNLQFPKLPSLNIWTYNFIFFRNEKNSYWYFFILFNRIFVI